MIIVLSVDFNMLVNVFHRWRRKRTIPEKGTVSGMECSLWRHPGLFRNASTLKTLFRWKTFVAIGVILSVPEETWAERRA